jgi:hypothetical protein
MLELGIFCVILLAAGYWAALWWMGRHDDVLHGKFVHSEDEAVDVARPAPPPFPRRPVAVARVADDTAEPVSSPALQSLLAAIQQDLRDVA